VRAVVLDANGLPELAEVPDPSGPGALVQVTACGLCGSDVEKLGHGPAGAVLGHEVEGVLADGARVTVMHRVPCGACERCLAGHESTCDAFGTLRIDPGGFAERLLATEWLTLPDELAPCAGIWVEPLACVLRAAERVPRGRVLVVGCGAIGLLWVQVLRGRGDVVVASDPRADRLAEAQRLGAVSSGAVDSAIVTAPAGVNAALERLEPGGTLLVFAAPGEPLPVDLDVVYRRELHLIGSRSATPGHFDAAIRLLPSLERPPVTALPLARFGEGVDLYRRGDVLKVVFTP
jgi:threonine dehydrogenase-like Zn-dependent dehydrogenase